MKLRILQPCLVRMNTHGHPGMVIEASKAEAAMLIAVGRAEPADKDAKVTPEEDLLRSDSESLDRHGRHSKADLTRLGLGPEVVETRDPKAANREPKGKESKAD